MAIVCTLDSDDNVAVPKRAFMTRADFHRSLPTKRMGSGALLRDEAGRFLIVKPSYKSGWEIPGGIVEDNESPAAACEREILEELGINVRPGRLLCVDYNSSAADHVESLMFIFAAPVLNADEVASITVDGEEIIEARWCEVEEGIRLLGPRLGPRVDAIFEHSIDSSYLEDQQPLPRGAH